MTLVDTEPPHPPVVVDERSVGEADLGEWGWVWQDLSIAGLIGGKKVAEAWMTADPLPATLELRADAGTLERFESVRLMVRALDQAGNKLPFLFDSVSISVNGPARLIGPEKVPLRGGSAGFWLVGTGEGQIEVTVTHPRLDAAKVSLVSE